MSGPPQPGMPRRRLLPLDPYASRQVAIHATLFVLTILCTLWVGARFNAGELRLIEYPFLINYPLSKTIYAELVRTGWAGLVDLLRAGFSYSATLMTILLFHEMGHFVAGRVHRVRLSLPFFIPIPFFLGTFGALIAMPPLESRKKLIDVGAAGPLAGLVVSTITMVIGLSLSEVQSLGSLEPGTAVLQEGQSLYYMAIKLVVLGSMPPGHDVFLHPIAWASWIGFLVTMLNLLPVGQLDGGHVAYAVLGERQNRYSGYLHLGLIGLGVVVSFVEGIGTGFVWFIWAALLYLIRRLGRGYHPPAPDPTPLGAGRIAVGIFCLVLFALLFMPVPLRVIQP